MSLMLGLVFIGFGAVFLFLASRGFSSDKPFHEQLWQNILGVVNG